jgi:MFS family permease
MPLGGRAADLLGRRRVLVAGTSLFGLASIIGGLAGSSGVLIAARLAQGGGAAMMLPAALSILTTSFNAGGDRRKALGAWGGVAGLASAFGPHRNAIGDRGRLADRRRRRLLPFAHSVHGSYLTDLLPGLVAMSIGLGALIVALTTAAIATQTSNTRSESGQDVPALQPQPEIRVGAAA